MRRSHFALFFAVLFAATALPVLAEQDLPGSKDFPGISRMPNTFIQSYNYSQFDTFAFPIAIVLNNDKTQSVEGKRTFLRYKINEGVERTSALQKIRNYENAAKSTGGTVVWDHIEGAGNARTTLKLRKGASEVWVYVNAYTAECELTIVEKEAMAQEVTIDAKAMASSIADTGSVALYGIFFDTAKSEVKPDSQPAIDQIVQLLKDKPALKVGIVGHTDMVGDQAANIKLSQARAQAVVAELVKKGIAASRLIPFGAGPWAPVASNKAEEGRAKNRRVELVEIATQ